MRSAVPANELAIFGLESAVERLFSDAAHPDALADSHGRGPANVRQASADEPVAVAPSAVRAVAVVAVVAGVVRLAEWQIAAPDCFGTPVVENRHKSRRLLDSVGLLWRSVLERAAGTALDARLVVDREAQRQIGCRRRTATEILPIGSIAVVGRYVVDVRLAGATVS